MIRKTTGRLMLCAMLLSAQFLFAHVAHAQMGKMDTSHVSDDFFCVIRIDVEGLASQLKEARKDFERMSRDFKAVSTIDLTKAKALTFQFGDFDIGEGDPSFAATIEFSEKIDREEFLSKALDGQQFEEETVNGKTYLKPDSENDPHIYFESDRKFTMATPGAIMSILNAQGMGQMSSLLKTPPPGSEIIAVFNRSENFSKSVGDFMQSVKDIPLPLETKNIFANAQSGFAYLKLESGLPMMVSLTMKDKQAADELKKTLENTLSTFKTGLPMAKTLLQNQIKKFESEGGMPASEIEMMKSARRGLDIAVRALAGTELKANKNTVDMKVKHMGGMKELSDLMMIGLLASFYGLDTDIDGVAPEIRGGIAEPAPVGDAKKK